MSVSFINLIEHLPGRERSGGRQRYRFRVKKPARSAGHGSHADAGVPSKGQTPAGTVAHPL